MLPFPLSSVPHKYIYSELENCALCNDSCFAYKIKTKHNLSLEKSAPSKAILVMSEANTLSNLLNLRSAWSDSFFYTQEPFDVDWAGSISKLLGRVQAGAYISMPTNVYFLEYIVLKEKLDLSVVYEYNYSDCDNMDYLIFVRIDDKKLKDKYYLYNSKVSRVMRVLSNKTYSIKSNGFSFILCPVERDKVEFFRKFCKELEKQGK